VLNSIDVDYNGEKIEIPNSLPLLPLRDMVIFPNMVVPLLLGRQFSIDALQEAMVGEKLIFLCTQRKAEVEEPDQDDLYQVGMVARVLQVMKLPSQMIKVLVEGIVRGSLVDMYLDENCYTAELDFPEISLGAKRNDIEALSRQVSRYFEEYVRLSHRIPDEVLMYLGQIDDNQKLADTVAAHLEVKLKVRQTILEA
jgi:ATP-dependent Lon protease